MSQGPAEFLLRSVDHEILSGRRPEVGPRRTRHQTVTALEGIPMFAGFSRRHLERLAKETDEMLFTPGDVIIEEGMLGETLFVILEGRAKVLRGTRKVGVVLPGQFFGELSTLDGGPRTASVVAETRVRVVRLFRRTLIDLLRDEPRLTLDLLQGIVRRIRDIDRTLR
jgi:CRP-like cAMP-binding protein